MVGPMSPTHRTTLLGPVLAAAALAACGDGADDPGTPDAAPPPADPFVIPISATKGDVLLDVIAGPDGSFYAAGIARDPGEFAASVVVVKLTADGQLDRGFGRGLGIADPAIEYQVDFLGLHLATQSDGKLIVAAAAPTQVANPASSLDRDLIVVRLDATGAVDPSFGVGGRTVINLSDDDVFGWKPDAARAVAIGPNDAIYVLADRRGDADPDHTAVTVVKLTARGDVDASWGGAAGIPAVQVTGRNAYGADLVVLADGSVVVAGSSATPAIFDNRLLLFRLTPAGALDPGFGDQGVIDHNLLGGRALFTALVRHDDAHVIAAGFGQDDGPRADWLSQRFDVVTGEADPTWGGAGNGVAGFNPLGPTSTLTSGCDDAVALPDGRTLVLGSVGAGGFDEEDAVVAILGRDGVLDPASLRVVSFGPNTDDLFTSGAVSGDRALVVGRRHEGNAPHLDGSDDSYGMLLPVGP